MSRILIIGSEGQLGSELSNFLKDKKDTNSIVLSDIKENSSSSLKYVQLDAMNYSELEKTVKDFNFTTKKEDAVRRCSSEGYECKKMSIEKIKHFVSKEAFNIEGFGKKIVENFWNLNLIKLPPDIFKLDFKKIESLDGWGKQSVANLKYSINLLDISL